ncbi:MAG: hypothetical protein SGPRY_003700 [Prymnesium sp.]
MKLSAPSRKRMSRLGFLPGCTRTLPDALRSRALAQADLVGSDVDQLIESVATFFEEEAVHSFIWKSASAPLPPATAIAASGQRRPDPASNVASPAVALPGSWDAETHRPSWGPRGGGSRGGGRGHWALWMSRWWRRAPSQRRRLWTWPSACQGEPALCPFAPALTSTSSPPPHHHAPYVPFCPSSPPPSPTPTCAKKRL